jgi:hypothetical protein
MKEDEGAAPTEAVGCTIEGVQDGRTEILAHGEAVCADARRYGSMRRVLSDWHP